MREWGVRWVEVTNGREGNEVVMGQLEVEEEDIGTGVPLIPAYVEWPGVAEDVDGERPIDLFMLFVTTPMLEHIVGQTNECQPVPRRQRPGSSLQG